MFRGGHVSSYGTGIASGLADGGRVGFRTGGSYLSANQEMVLGSDLMNFVKQNPKYGSLDFANTLMKNQYYSKPTGRYEIGRGGPKIENSPEFLKLWQNFMDPETTLIDPDEVDIKTGETTKVEEDDNLLFEGKTESDYVSPTMTMKEEEWSGERDSNTSYVPPGVKIDQGEVVIEEDTGIEEMADKYFALMGGDKAWKKDASDMAMLASAKLLKPGATVTSGLGEFMEAEAAKGPGRAETIRKDATKFAITQDMQTKLLDKKIDAQKEIANNNLIATIAKLDKDGQYKKKVDDIINDRFGGDETKRAEASRIALGDHATIEAAIYDATKGGMPITPTTFDLLAASYTDGPMPTGDLAGMSGTFFVPGQMIIVEIINGVVDQNSTKDFSGKAKKS